MDRVLRLLAVLSLVANIAFSIVIERGPRPNPDPSFKVYNGLWWPLMAQTSYMFAFAVGVVALTAAVWRRHIVWAVLLSVVLVAFTYGLIVAFYFNVPSRLLPSLLNLYNGSAILADAIAPAILPLLALTYSFWPRRRGLAPSIEVTRLGAQARTEGDTETAG